METDAALPFSPSRTAPSTMSAIYYEDYGPPEVLRYGKVRAPVYRAGHVRIQVVASSVNPVDWRTRKGELRRVLPGRFPRVPGFDVAGYVHQGGESLGLTPGSRVLAFLGSVYGGAYAEWAVCALDCVAAIPDRMTFEEAAALPLAGSTALQSLRDHGRIRRGDRVLINGASGGVGCFAIQIAKAYGAHVTAVSSGENEEFVRSLGADAFIDYHESDFTDHVQRWDVIFDVAAKSSFLRARDVLTPRGRYVTTEPDLQDLLTSIVTLATHRRGRAMLARSRRRDLEELVRLYEKDQLKIVIDEVFPLAKAADAHRKSESHHARGKLVLKVADGI